MAERFVSLKCDNCGGKLDVYDDMQRFACGYCGAEMVVQRRGGTVALKAITDAIRKVQIGTDKAAAELAIVRYEADLKRLRAKEANLLASRFDSHIGVGAGCFMVVVGLVMIAYQTQAGWLVFAGGPVVIAGVLIWQRENSAELREARAEVRALEETIAEKRCVADSR